MGLTDEEREILDDADPVAVGKEALAHHPNLKDLVGH